MKILHVIDSGGLYGAEVMLINLASAQLELGISIVIGSIRKPNSAEKAIETEARLRGIDICEFPMRPGINLAGARRILHYARTEKFDIIHSHGYKSNILLGFVPFWLRRIPIVTTLHGWTSTEKWTKIRVNEELDALSLRCVDKIVLVNRGMLDKKKVQCLPSDKLHIIDNGIEIEEKEKSVSANNYSETTFSEISKFCSKGLVVASIGRLSKEKGFNYLIQAIHLLRHKYDQKVRLMLIGDGKLRQELQEQAEHLGLTDFFLITGYFINAKTLLDFVDVYVISSLTEGLPITLLEAMASKTSIVATRVGGIPYVIENGKEGLLVPPTNAEKLAIAIQTMINEDLLRKNLIENAYAKVINNYNHRKMAKKYSDLYCKVLEEFK